MRTKNNIAGKVNFYLSGMPDVEAARPYDFLCEMDKVEGSLMRLKNHMAAQIDYGDAVLDELHNLKDTFPEDMLTQLEEEQESLSSYYDGLVSWRESLLQAPEIFREHDTLPDTLNRAIEVAKGLFDQQEAIRWAIMEHNVDWGPKGESSIVSSVDELRKALASL